MASIFDRAASAAASLTRQGVKDGITGPGTGSIFGTGAVATGLLRTLNSALGDQLSAADAAQAVMPLVGGGVRQQDLQQMLLAIANTKYTMKNWWNITVSDLQNFYIDGTGAQIKKQYAPDINFFCTELGYQNAVNGSAIAVGSGHFDTINSRAPVEIRMNCLDDLYGTVKRWFAERFNIALRQDGTLGLPAEYLFRVDVLHGFIGGQVAGSESGYVDTFVMRVGSIDKENNRRENAIQELAITLVQYDTFSGLAGTT